MTLIPFLQARHFTPVIGAARRIDHIVIHTMENAEKPSSAEDVAAWFASPNAPRASAHYNIDADSIVQSVKDKDVAWAAPGANHDGLQFEHAGRASQTAQNWGDPYSVKMLERSAKLAAEKATLYHIPVKLLTVAELKRGVRGFVGHAQVSLAFRRSDHTDPGRFFPWLLYLQLVQRNMPADPVNFVTVQQARDWWQPGKLVHEMLPGPRPKPEEWYWDSIEELDRRRRLAGGT